MPRGPKKHLKRLNAPSHWMLDKLSGVFAPRPSPGPHKLRECLPLIIFLRNRLKYALNYDEAKKILKKRLIKVDGKVRTDLTFPAGFMAIGTLTVLKLCGKTLWKNSVEKLGGNLDFTRVKQAVELRMWRTCEKTAKQETMIKNVITIEKTGENFRLLYDGKGRFTTHRITGEEAKYKLCRIKRVAVGAKGIPYCVTNDGRTIRYPDPSISIHDTVRVDIKSGKITEYIKFDNGNLTMIVGGRNMGRVGVITHREKHAGSFDIVHVKDAKGHQFATRMTNVFVIGKGSKEWVSLPRGKGIRLTIAEERDRRLAEKVKH